MALYDHEGPRELAPLSILGHPPNRSREMKTKLSKPLIHSLYKVFSRVPLLGMAVKRWKINKNFALERKVLKGQHQSTSKNRSILFFSVYRAGSTFSGGLMKKIAGEAGLTAVDLDGYFYELGKGKEWEGKGRVMLDVPYRSTGYFYGPFRSFNRGIRNIEDYKILLLLRDPGDVIVSSYYAIYSHVTPLLEGKQALRTRVQRREKQLEQTVDEFVINRLNSNSRFLERYYEYHKELMGKTNVLFLKYENMVENFDTWLDRLIEFLGMDLSREFIHRVKAEADFKVSKEDIHKHKRQVTPGDHIRKLKPETIDFLNSKTGEIRKLFGYEAPNSAF